MPRASPSRSRTSRAPRRKRRNTPAVAAGQRPFEVRQSHELAGRIALAEKNYKLAVTELRRANDQDPRVLYLTALALQGAGEAQKAKEVGARAADFNGLSATYGYVRGKAKAMITTPKRD